MRHSPLVKGIVCVAGIRQPLSQPASLLSPCPSPYHHSLQANDWNTQRTIGTLKAPLRFVKELEGSDTASRCRDPDMPQNTWNDLWCYDYVWDPGLGAVPPRGFLTSRQLPEVDPSTMVCPEPKNGIVLVAFQNAGSSSLCNLVWPRSRMRLAPPPSLTCPVPFIPSLS